MSLTEQEQAQANIERAQAETRVKLGKAFERLHTNKDFKLLISEGYFKDYAAQQVSLLADPGTNKEEVHAGLRGISELLAYFRAVEMHATVAQRTVDELNQAENE